MKRDAFSRYDGCRVVMPNGPFSFFVFSVDVQRVSGSHAERPFFCVCSVLIFNGCRVVTKERLNVQCLMPSQSPLLLLC